MSPTRHEPSHLQALQTFALLKAQIISLATALYGTHAANPTTAFDVLTYTINTSPSVSPSAIPTPPQTQTQTPTNDSIHAVALVTYPTPAHTTWELLSHIEHQSSPISAAQSLLNDLRAGLGGVMAELHAKGTYTVHHATVPDVAGAGGAVSAPSPREHHGVGRRSGKESGSCETWDDAEDGGAAAMDGCYDDEEKEAGDEGKEWRDDVFDIESQTTLASIPEEEE